MDNAKAKVQPPAEAQPVGKVSKDTGLTVTLERLPYYTGTRLAKGTELYAHREDVRALLREAADALESAREDAARLDWLATDGCIEGFVGVEYDIYDYACGVAEESGREEPNGSDMLAGLRRLVDAAREAHNG